MGCDIHCYMEYKQAGSEDWNGFGGRINPGRYYGIFARLAGVRNYNEVEPVVVSPRGFPDDTSWEARGDYWLYVTDTSGEGYCSRAQAESYVKHGSVWKDDEKKFVSHPDHHTHSWVTPNEWEKAIAPAEDAYEYQAVLCALRHFESKGCSARVVFWFDN